MTSQSMFGLLGLIGVAATLLVVLFIPETLRSEVQPSEVGSRVSLSAGATVPLRDEDR